MQRSEPVLTDPDDIRIWNKIDAIGRDHQKKKRQQDKLSVLAVIDDALSTSKQMHSAVLVKILRKAAHEEINDLESVAIKVLDMCRPGDMYPIMEAADIVIKDGNLDIARSLMNKMVSVPDTAFMEYLKGIFAYRSKDHAGAVDHLIRSNAIDQSLMRTYDALISIDPEKGWDVLRNIQLIISGERPEEVRTGDLELTELQEIYDGWFNGDRGMARKRLETSAGYSSGHLDFLLAAARMTGDIFEYSRSLEFYDRILSQYPNIDSMIIEKANILAAMRRRDETLALLDALGKESSRNRNFMECMLRTLASKSTEREFTSYSEGFMRSEHGDRRGYMLVCELMSGIGMNDRAGKILETLLPMFPDDMGLHLMNARNELKLGKDASAIRSADKAVKLSPKTADGYCIRAEIHLKYGRTKNALRDGEYALKCDADHLASLIVMSGARIRSKEYDKALEICRRILIFDPHNAEAVKNMAYALDMMGKRQDAIEEYKNALRLNRDPKMLMTILSDLMDGDRAADASEIAREFIGNDERDADLWCLKGNAEYQSSNFTDASRSYAKALETRPHDARLWHSKGLAEEMANMLKESESSYDRAVIIDLDNTEFWLSKAIVQEKRGDLKGSVLSLNRVISGSPDNVYALVRKTRILASLGMADEAMFFLDRALKVDSRNIKILNIKKNIYKRSGSDDKVIEVCRDILRVDKRNIDALSDLAETYQKLGRHDDALKVLSNVSADLGEVGVLMMKKHSAKLNGNTDVEVEACRSILKIEPDNRAIRLELADALIRNDELREAMVIYDGMQSDDPKDAEVIILRGKLRALMGDGSSAVALYNEAVLEDPDNCDTLNELANALCDSGEYREALNMISRAIELEPEAPRGHIARSRILLSMNDAEGALASLTKALDDVTEAGELYMTIGEIYERRGDLDSALASYDAAIRDGMDSGNAYYSRGRVLESLGSRDAAMKSYSAAVSKDRANVRAWERMGTIHMEEGHHAEAKKDLDSALAAAPFDLMSLLSLARLYVKDGSTEKAIPIYRALSGRDDSTPEIERELNGLVRDEYADAPDAAEEKGTYVPDVKEYAEIGSTYDLALLTLEQAYATGSAISDAKMLSKLGINGKDRTMVLKYLSDIEEYGEIDVRSKEFERMERLSKNVILAEKIDDIDSNPLVGIPAAYMTSKAETVDDAKKLIAYIYKAMTDDSEPAAFSADVRDAAAEASEMSGDITTYDLMRRFNVGVYTARTIGRLSKMDRKKGADMHI